MATSAFIGQTLDDKYLIERELGRGGMGTVYLATHLGTERPVAVKIVAPQFMKRPEFVERFRREARAAGRLRHPNVVDVTDFGFAETSEGRVAYLVMEYLDGCTLGEILEEEKNLPISWTLDILEQICSAVEAAHNEGIIHRDLKPDNIWLEPNMRGGYTVKVLDFGIAKLEADHGQDHNGVSEPRTSVPTQLLGPKLTVSGMAEERTHHDDGVAATMMLENPAANITRPIADITENETMIQVQPDGDSHGIQKSVAGEDEGTRLFSEQPDTDSASLLKATARGDLGDLTRVGAVLGTPLYMSPEQCRGDRLDSRSDIYSIGVIAYQMISGSPPFTGDFTSVMESHRENPAPPLVTKGVRKKLRKVIASSLEKDPADRPQSCVAFASLLRSRSEGVFGILRRSGMIYTAHMPKFLKLSALFHAPVILLLFVIIILSLLSAGGYVDRGVSSFGIGLTGVLYTAVTALCVSLITGTITWIVIHSLAVPLRPIRLRDSLREARSKLKTFAGAGLINIILSIGGAALVGVVIFVLAMTIGWLLISVEAGAVAGIVLAGTLGSLTFFGISIFLMLSVPSVMMENLGVFGGIRRSLELVRRSILTSIGVYAIMLLIPLILAFVMSLFINLIAREVDRSVQRTSVAAQTQEEAKATDNDAEKDERSFSINLSTRDAVPVKITDTETEKADNTAKNVIIETITQILVIPLQILSTSFTAIFVALLYLKTRQAGGEPLQDLFFKFEESDKPRKKWQERVRQGLIRSGRISGSGIRSGPG
ncbi:MAG: protein kinase [Acidobacteria bacterium]|nr:protein kinase [Acidobacteriota bacterium]